jgi:glucose/mannose-6-phosphate isomerase
VTVLPGAGERLDTLGMWDLTLGLPEQVEQAVGLVGDLDGMPSASEVDRVVVLGMGGSGVSGDVLAAIAGPVSPVPVTVVKGYECPAFVDHRTLCFAASFSGDTEETVEAAGAAAAAGARLVVLSSGGRLADLAASTGAPRVVLPSAIPMPRAAIGLMAVPPLLVMEAAGLLPGAGIAVDAAVAQLRRRRDALAGGGGPARHLAREIGLTFPLVYGGGAVGAVAALRWKNQVNENAKAPAFAHAYPELCHNEICGWGQHGDVTRQVLTLVQLRHDHEHPQVARRFPLVQELVGEAVASVVEVRAEGDGPLAQLFDLVLVGDVVSLHLAFDAGIDPGPIPVLDQLKASLASPPG